MVTRDDPRGWASRSLGDALWQSSVLGVALWQVLIAVLVAGRTPDVPPALVAAHVLVAAAAFLGAVVGPGETARAVWFAVLLGLLVVDLAVTQDSIAVTVLCMTAVVAATPFLVLRWYLAVLVVGAWVLAASIVAAGDGGGPAPVALAIAVPVAIYSGAAYALVTVLRRFARAVDDEAAVAERQHRLLVADRAAARSAAELARTLHDTAVNTLAAVASGGPAVADVGRVRRRCSEDVQALRDRAEARDGRVAGLLGVASDLAVTVQWSGLGPEEREEAVESLGRTRGGALLGIVRELLLNVEKHAGAARATVEVERRDGALVVSVRDDGPGFVVGTVAERGLARSVRERAAAAGFAVEIVSAPGQGVRGTVVCPSLDAGPAPGERPPGPAASARRLTRTATWGWCAAVTTASLAAGAVGTGTPATFASVGLVALASLAAWVTCRGDRDLPRSLGLVICLVLPVAFVLAYQGALGPGGDPAFWQSIGLTPLMVILLNVSTHRWLLPLAGGLLAAVAGATAALGQHDVPGASFIVLANAAIQLMQIGVWLLFAQALRGITDRAAHEHRQTLQDRAERAAIEAAAATQERWRDGQIEVAVELLQELADGRASPLDPQVQMRAGQEEQSLRQLLTLTPDLVHLGPWLARSIGQARRRDIRLSVRTGSIDLPDAQSASWVGLALRDVLDRVEPGSDVVVAHYARRAEPVVTVVGPAGFCDLGRGLGHDVSGVIRARHHGRHDLVELVPAAAIGLGRGQAPGQERRDGSGEHQDAEGGLQADEVGHAADRG